MPGLQLWSESWAKLKTFIASDHLTSTTLAICWGEVRERLLLCNLSLIDWLCPHKACLMSHSVATISIVLKLKPVISSPEDNVINLIILRGDAHAGTCMPKWNAGRGETQATNLYQEGDLDVSTLPGLMFGGRCRLTTQSHKVSVTQKEINLQP